MSSSRPASKSFMTESPKHKAIYCGIIIVAIIIVAIVGMFVHKSYFSTEAAIQGDKYQAVFMTNGQVYFGKLTDVDKGYAKLTQIYYLQVQQQVQPKDAKDQQPQVSLTKLGNELHGPDDSMYISRDQVLFWENLKNDGKVAQAIKSYQDQQKK